VDLLFGRGGDLLWWQECARALVIFVYGLAAVRIAGRRMFGKWGALDMILSVIVGSSLSRVITGSAELGGTLAAITLLIALHWVLARIAARVRWFSRVVEGAPTVLARGGRIEPSQLRAAAVSQNDLDEAMRQSGVEDVAQTRLMMVESSGRISVLKAEQT
jgi:uncharacterized membrane protein YcaP (DUF421 family)